MTDHANGGTSAFPRHGWLWPWVLILAISGVSGTSNPQLPGDFTVHDKLAHFLVFGLLATTLIRLPVFHQGRWWMLVICIAVPSAFGGLDEWHQSWVPGRTMDFMDWLADTLGAATAVFAYRYLHWYRRALEWRFSLGYCMNSR